jgi:hypothetical protein
VRGCEFGSDTKIHDIYASEKNRFAWISSFSNKKISFIELENIAIQVRKIIESIAYGFWCLHDNEEILRGKYHEFNAIKIIDHILDNNLATPIPVDIDIDEISGVFNWRFKERILINYNSQFKEMYEKANLFGHETHPYKLDHFFHGPDGEAEAVLWASEALKEIKSIIWKHMVIWDEFTLFVDFGNLDDAPPKYRVWFNPDNLGE